MNKVVGMILTHKNTFRAIEAILALLLVYLLVKITLALVLTGDTGLPPKLDTQTVQVSSKSKFVIDDEIFSEFDIFNRAKPITETVAIEENAPETTLNLKVYGMRADLGGDTSSAIIQTPDLKQAIYYVGDEIIPNVTLKSVSIDFVILDRNGVNERLSRQGRKEGEVSANQTLQIGGVSFKARDLINNVRFYPKRMGRQVIGYRVMARRGVKLEDYGLERNDIVIAINGEDMSGGKVNLPNLWKNFKLARYASIQVLRDDVPMTIEVNLQ
ncbi:MAG: hypothetical protein COA43_03025 [Robiginitomaculum sp.]|nr:MAG: hypothetical protein COA43_03025 [Robiginitomaculum sp.]